MTLKSYRHIGEGIKALEGNRVSGYLVRFTSRDAPDLHGEYFTKDTNFWLKELSPIGKPIFLDHTFDGKFKAIPVGVIDFLREDEIGLWIEGKLKERAEYEDMLRGWKNRKWLSDEQLNDEAIPLLAKNLELAVKAFFGTGKAQWSSGALPQVVETAEDGHIESWPIIEGTGVFTPAEPTGTEIGLKSVLNQMSEILSSIPVSPAKEAIQPIEQTTDKSHKQQISITPNKGQNKMDAMAFLNQLATMLQEFLAGAGAPEGEAMAMADEVVDEMKADVEALPEEEKAKAMDEELVKAYMGKAIAKAEAKIAKRAQLHGLAKNEAQKALDAWKHKQPANPETGALPRYVGGGNQRVSVGDNLKYAHMSADDMALGITTMMAQARSSGFPVTVKNFVDAGALSPEFLQVFKGKVKEFADSNPYGTTQEGRKRNSVIKSLAMKANEIDATDNTGFGTEWVGDFWSTTLWAKERYPLVYDKLVQKGMMVEELGQGVDTAYFPIEGADPIAYRAPQANDLGSDNRPEVTAKINPFATGNVTVTPGEIKIATSYTRIFDEDSLIRLAPQVNKQLTEKAWETRDQLCINGDTETAANTNINKINGTPTSTGITQDYYLTSNGFRKMALVTAPAASVTSAVSAAGLLTDAQYLTTRKLFSGELRPYLRDNGLFIVDPDTYEASLAFASLKTDDVNKTGATVREGELVKMWGVEVFNSGFLPESDTTGKVSTTANLNLYGTILGVFAKHWGIAYKRQIIIDTEFDALSGTYVYVLSMRIGLVARGTKAAVASYYVGN